MPRDLEGLADVVVLTVKTAMAPVLERLALVEQENLNLKASLATLAELRDRVVVVETKSAMPLPIPVTSEVPPPVDLTPLIQQIESLERGQEVSVAALSSVRDRMVTVETKTAGLSDARAVIEPLAEQMTVVRERVAALEARAPIAGPPGKDGQDGKDGQPGQPGRDGIDGLGFEDMDVAFDDRTLTLKFERGQLKKTWPITLPYLQYEGVYIEGKSYDRGSVVTWAGSTWHANEQTTSKPGEGSKAWTLIVKRGRDGKDGRDAMDPMPVVSVGGKR